jgi:hypothetical protein
MFTETKGAFCTAIRLQKEIETKYQLLNVRTRLSSYSTSALKLEYKIHKITEDLREKGKDFYIYVDFIVHKTEQDNIKQVEIQINDAAGHWPGEPIKMDFVEKLFELPTPSEYNKGMSRNIFKEIEETLEKSKTWRKYVI